MRKILTTIFIAVLFCFPAYAAASASPQHESSTETIINQQKPTIGHEGLAVDKKTTEEVRWIETKSTEYPIDLSNPQWASFTSHAEMLGACDMPNTLLRKSNTNLLLSKALNYPLLCDLFAYDNFDIALDALKQQSNIFRELLSRDDLPKAVLTRYRTAQINSISINYEEDFKNVATVQLLEALLSHLNDKNKLNEVEKIDSRLLFQKKQSEKDASGLFVNTQQSLVDTSLFKVSGIDTLSVKTAQKAANKTTSVKTPNGTKIQVYCFKFNGNSWSNALTNQYKKAYPLATVLGKADNRYNCHSYAWFYASTANLYWMNSPKKYVSDKSYKYVGKAATTKGHKIVYKYKTSTQNKWIHSGIVYSKNKVTSKWGQAPLMRHNVGYCPYAGQYNTIHTYKRNK